MQERIYLLKIINKIYSHLWRLPRNWNQIHNLGPWEVKQQVILNSPNVEYWSLNMRTWSFDESWRWPFEQEASGAHHEYHQHLQYHRRYFKCPLTLYKLHVTTWPCPSFQLETKLNFNRNINVNVNVYCNIVKHNYLRLWTTSRGWNGWLRFG